MPLVNVGMRTYRAVHPDTQASLIALLLHSREKIRDFLYRNFLYADEAANQLVQQTLDDPQVTHLLFLDSDMTWPADTLERLLAHEQPIVGANYFRRQPPYDTVAGHFADYHVQPLQFLEPRLMKVDCLGLGCTLIATDVFRQLQKITHSEEPFLKADDGEDVSFFKQVGSKLGIQPYLDASLECGHITEQVVTSQHWRMTHRVMPAADPSLCNFGDLYEGMVRLAANGSKFVEVGSFLGASAIRMLRAIQSSGKKIEFTCVDHFKGSADYCHQELAKTHGGNYRRLFEDNIRKHGLWNEPFLVIEDDSVRAAQKFKDASLDFVFIDAEHTREAVEADIRAWLPKIKPGGVLAGHDYDWRGVREAVQEILPAAKPCGENSWIWNRPT